MRMPLCVGILVCFYRFSYDRRVGQVCPRFVFVGDRWQSHKVAYYYG